MRSGTQASRTVDSPAIHVVVFAIAVGVPISYGLPPNIRTIWTLATAAFLVLSFILGKIRTYPGWEIWAIATFLAIVSGVSAATNAVSVSEHVQVALYFVMLWGVAPPVFTYYVDRHENLARVAAIGFVLSQSVSSVEAMRQAVFGSDLVSQGRAEGFSGHPNILGMLASIAVVLCIAAIASGRYRKTAIVLLLVNGGAVFASASLTSLFSLVVGALVLFIAMRVKFSVIFWSLASFGLLLWGVVRLSEVTSIRTPLSRIMQTTGQTEAAGTLEIRLNTIEYAWTRIERDWFFGAGLDDQSGVTFDGVTLTHDLPIRAWFQGGIALFVAIVLIYVYAIYVVVRAVSARVGAVEAGVIATMLAFALTSASFQQPYFWLPFILCSSSILAKYRRVKPGASLEWEGPLLDKRDPAHRQS